MMRSNKKSKNLPTLNLRTFFKVKPYSAYAFCCEVPLLADSICDCISFKIVSMIFHSFSVSIGFSGNAANSPSSSDFKSFGS